MSITKKEAEAFLIESEEIIENLKGIKGELYTNGLLLILNVINLNKVTAAILGARTTTEEGERLHTLANTVLSDTIMRVAELLCPSSEAPAFKILCMALSKDVRILVDKQDEYTVKVQS